MFVSHIAYIPCHALAFRSDEHLALHDFTSQIPRPHVILLDRTRSSLRPKPRVHGTPPCCCDSTHLELGGEYERGFKDFTLTGGQSHRCLHSDCAEGYRTQRSIHNLVRDLVNLTAYNGKIERWRTSMG